MLTTLENTHSLPNRHVIEEHEGMQVDTEEPYPFLTFYELLTASFGRDAEVCDKTVQIEPAGLRMSVSSVALARLPALRSYMRWCPRRSVYVFQEDDDEAFCILLEALHRKPSTWIDSISKLQHRCLDVLQVAKKYRYRELERTARCVAISNISRATAPVLADYLERSEWDCIDGNLSECPSPQDTCPIAAALVSWFRTRKPLDKYPALLDRTGERFPTWCLLQLVAFAGHDNRRQAALRALWARRKRMRESGAPLAGGWDVLLDRICALHANFDGFAASVRGLLGQNREPRLKLGDWTALKRHNSDNQKAHRASVPRIWRERRASDPIGSTGEEAFVRLLCPVPEEPISEAVQVEAVSQMTWRPQTGYGYTPPVTFSFNVGGTPIEASVQCTTQVKNGERIYAFGLSLGLLPRCKRVRMFLACHLAVSQMFFDEKTGPYCEWRRGFEAHASSGQNLTIARHSTSPDAGAHRVSFRLCLRASARK